MFLDRLNFKLVNIECMPTSTKFNAIVDLEVDIEDLLPYLATVIQIDRVGLCKCKRGRFG